MKLIKFVKESRDSMLDALKHISELKIDEQSYALSFINNAIGELDKLSEILKSPHAAEQQTLFDNSNDKYKIIKEQIDNDTSTYKLMVLRVEPTEYNGQKMSGYLKTFHLPVTIPDIIEQIGEGYGGGKYQIRIVDSAGQYIKSKTFEIVGIPELPKEENNAN